MMSTSDEIVKARYNMVRWQIKGRDISDHNVLVAMEKVERHLFVSPDYQKEAYQDRPLSIDYGQTISQPYIVALMTELLELSNESKVLEIGTGCGYQTAILAELVKDIYTIEIIPELADSAKKRLDDLNYSNIYLKQGNGYYGWIEHAPYDGILVTAAPKNIPYRLTQQLVDGGRMVIPIGSTIQELLLIEKCSDKVETTSITSVSFVPMTGAP